MAYNPLQARDRKGRWVAKAGNAAFRGGAKALVGSGTKARPSSSSRSVKGRGKGVKGFKANFVPYGRVNKRSQTVGFNAGTVVTKRKRVVVGAYARIESTTKHTTADKIAGKAASKVLPTTTRRGRAARAFKRNFSVNNPALRATIGGSQARLSTSRGAGPTIVVRRGKHKTPQAKSAAGVQQYDNRMRAIAGKKAAKVKKRPQRRKAARKKR
ncbi:head maturation protease [Mycobacterium phage DrLupo]|uniref:Capsid maturation protease n=1 Tax=Mycobacterium phage DrLupo TaxID=2499037 RepID=A0A3S9UQJ6_9CAUD|nr:head maturation protease [Mycobacterium phage DrLupo]AZS12554.1 capsid maturation protease [Mycobacterium phage DrLupo]